MNDQLIRIKQAAAMLECSPQTVRNMIKRGTITGAQKLDPGLRNSPLRIPRSEIEKILTIRQYKEDPVKRAFEKSYKNFEIMNPSKK